MPGVLLWPIAKFDAEMDLVTPAEETLAPVLTGLCNFKAGSLPVVDRGLTPSRRGVAVTAFGPNPDGDGTLLRLWELAGASGDCTVRLPETMKVKSVQRPSRGGGRARPPGMGCRSSRTCCGARRQWEKKKPGDPRTLATRGSIQSAPASQLTREFWIPVRRFHESQLGGQAAGAAAAAKMASLTTPWRGGATPASAP